ncbi:AbrB/MazE/SpoVT family DNA-binding domain-containing protein [Candidatus Woesebacteria bacterium]|nr:AbrB/MazE/SpoVT family DNA-binding domain-containing protein [Candidatus Woesebacteria bacterium]
MLNLTTISQKGQIVVPKKFRDSLGLKPSDVLKVSKEKNRLVMEPVDSLEQMFGAFKAKKAIAKSDIKEAKRTTFLRKFTS